MKLWPANSGAAFHPSLRSGRCAPASGLVVLAVCLSATPLYPQAPTFADGERLSYAITWPSGLSLGETEFWARATTQGWEFEATIIANLPTLEVRDEYRAKADSSLCSQEFEKNAKHDDRKTREVVEFDQQKHQATRKTLGGGGESQFNIPPCARDGLTFLYFLREQLAAGRIPPPDDVNFGAQYQISVTYLESVDVEAGGRRRPADRILVDLTGPKSQHGFEIFFGRDPARTPLLIHIPFEMGTFSLRLAQ